MKIKTNVFAIAIIVAILSLSSCKTANESEKIVNDFYEAYNYKDFKTIKNISNPQIGDLMEEFAENHYDKFGEILSWEKYNSEVFNANEKISTELYYKCKYSKTDDFLFVKFTVLEDNDEYRIDGFTYDKNQDIIDNSEENYQDAKETGITFYKYIMNNELDAIAELFDQEYIIDEGNEENFHLSINNRQDYYGNIKSYSISTFSTKVIDDLPVFIIIYDCVTDNGNLIEEISFIKRGSEFKIINYRYADSFETLQDL